MIGIWVLPWQKRKNPLLGDKKHFFTEITQLHTLISAIDFQFLQCNRQNKLHNRPITYHWHHFSTNWHIVCLWLPLLCIFMQVRQHRWKRAYFLVKLAHCESKNKDNLIIWQTKNKDHFAVFSRWFLFHVNMMSMWLLNAFGYIWWQFKTWSTTSFILQIDIK